MRNISEVTLLNEFTQLVHLDRKLLSKLLNGFDADKIESALSPLPHNYQEIFVSCLNNTTREILMEYRKFLLDREADYIKLNGESECKDQSGRERRSLILAKYFSFYTERYFFNFLKHRPPIEIDMKNQFLLLTRLSDEERCILLNEVGVDIISKALYSLSSEIKNTFLNGVLETKKKEIEDKLNNGAIGLLMSSSCQNQIISLYFKKVVETGFEDRVVKNIYMLPKEYDRIREEIIKEVKSKGGIIKSLGW